MKTLIKGAAVGSWRVAELGEMAKISGQIDRNFEMRYGPEVEVLSGNKSLHFPRCVE